MFREDSDLISEILEILPIEEMEKKFSGKEITPLQFIAFISKKKLLGQIVSKMKVDGTESTIIDIAKAINFYKGMYNQVIEIISS
jgi:hypothetical protein